MKKLFLWFLLLINCSMVAMFCGCLCEDDEEPRSTIFQDPFLPVLQKFVKDSDNNWLTYCYNRLSKRWNLISKRPSCTDKDTSTEIEMIYYIPSEYYGWAEVYEYYREFRGPPGRSWERPRKLTETLTLEQYHRLDLKENGQFVTGAD